MLNNNISVFNQLTHNGLADCSLFENMLTRHYEKFKYFYSIINNISLKSIADINCIEDIDILNIFIRFNTKKERDIFFNLCDNKINECTFIFKKYFIFSYIKEDKSIVISIKNNNITKEQVIYG